MIKAKGKPDNVWSVDNELAAQEKERGRPTRRRGKRRVVRRKGSKDGDGRAVLVSGAMLMEVETVLQTQVLLFLVVDYVFGPFGLMGLVAD